MIRIAEPSSLKAMDKVYSLAIQQMYCVQIVYSPVIFGIKLLRKSTEKYIKFKRILFF